MITAEGRWLLLVVVNYMIFPVLYVRLSFSEARTGSELPLLAFLDASLAVTRDR